MKFWVPRNVQLALEVEQAIDVQLLHKVYYLAGEVLELLSHSSYWFFLVSIVVASVDIGEHILFYPL